MALTTKAQYDQLPPSVQGFVQYWEGGQEGSELRDLQNPYPAGSKKAAAWYRGQQLAVQEAQDAP
jgi:hypothetical protein